MINFIELAKRAKELGIKTIAVKRNRNRQLAQACREIVPLKITMELSPPPGFGAFVANVITCLQIVGVRVLSQICYMAQERARNITQFTSLNDIAISNVIPSL